MVKIENLENFLESNYIKVEEKTAPLEQAKVVLYEQNGDNMPYGAFELLDTLSSDNDEMHLTTATNIDEFKEAANNYINNRFMLGIPTDSFDEIKQFCKSYDSLKDSYVCLRIVEDDTNYDY